MGLERIALCRDFFSQLELGDVLAIEQSGVDTVGRSMRFFEVVLGIAPPRCAVVLRSGLGQSADQRPSSVAFARGWRRGVLRAVSCDAAIHRPRLGGPIGGPGGPGRRNGGPTMPSGGPTVAPFQSYPKALQSPKLRLLLSSIRSLFVIAATG